MVLRPILPRADGSPTLTTPEMIEVRMSGTISIFSSFMNRLAMKSKGAIQRALGESGDISTFTETE